MTVCPGINPSNLMMRLSSFMLMISALEPLKTECLEVKSVLLHG